MRAARLTEPAPVSNKPLHILDVPRAEPGPGEILIRVAACAVCRTDLQLAEGDLEARRLPITPGHQAVGAVAAVGPGVQGWTAGDRAGLAWLGGACGRCEFCIEGRENLGQAAWFTGWDRDGGFAEYVVADARFALRIPQAFANFDAAPLLCGGVIGYRSLKVSGVQSGQRLGLFGFGASASLAIQVAVHWGCELFVATRSVREQRRALELGAAWAGGYDERPPMPLHAAITFAPAGEVALRALESLERGGTVAINAIHLDRVPEFDYSKLWWERSIRSVANFTRRDAQEFLELAAEIPVRTAVDRYPLESANEALLDLANGAVSGAAVLECG